MRVWMNELMGGGWVAGWASERMDGWVDMWMNEYVGGWMSGWVDRLGENMNE
jgi:hypothetical protein